MTLLVLTLAGFSMPAFASTDAVNTSSVSATLRLNVTVQNVMLKPVQRASNGACAIHTNDYSMSFGSVGAAAINTPTCGSEVEPTASSGSSPAHFTVMTPVFPNQVTSNAGGTQSGGYVGVTVRSTKSGKPTGSEWHSATVTHTITAR